MMEQFRLKNFPCGFKEVVTATTQEPGSTIVSVERDKCITPETFNVIPVAKYDTGSTSVELFLESTGLWLVGVIDTSPAGGVQLGNVAAERRPVMISPCPHCNGHNIRLNEEWEYRPN